MDFVCKDGVLKHTLIISPPCCGKTTLLRDIVRQLSQGSVIPAKKVCVVDERSEIAACVDGIPQNHLGERTDVIDCCPKAEGMLMVIRAMSPDIVAVDEIGGKKDIEAIESVIHCGCIVIGTVHGADVKELYQKPELGALLKRGVFGRLIVLSGKMVREQYRNVWNYKGGVSDDKVMRCSVHCSRYNLLRTVLCVSEKKQTVAVKAV